MKRILFVFLILLLFTGCSKEDVKKTIDELQSSLVSQGVEEDDLGNIVNGQYFFDDGDNQYYSSFDLNGNPHIYLKDKSTGNIKTIFDGFGWSFAVNDGWLYFSGNAGTSIDATYTLYRCKTDGSDLEHLIDKYTVNMNFYNDWLYYSRKADYDSQISSVYRASLDGSNEEEIVSGVSANGLSVVFNNKLYYMDSNNYMYRANVDGTNKEQILSDKIDQFIIGKGRIIYLDQSDNIKSCKEDGTDIKTIRASDGTDINRINSYDNILTYVTYGEFDYSTYSWDYSIYTISIDGLNDLKVYDSYSYGFYVNILNDKIYVLDYYQDSSFNKLIVITRNMNLDGSNLQDLYR